MITRSLIAAVVGIALIGGTIADASAKIVVQTGTKTAVTQTIGGKQTRKVAVRHRTHVSHRAMTKRAKLASGKRIVVSHISKRVMPRHV